MKRALVLSGILVAASGCSDENVEDLLGIDMYFVKLAEDPAEVANTASWIAESFGVRIVHTYDVASEGFSVKLPGVLVPELEALPEVDYISIDEKRHKAPPEEEPVEEPVEDPAPLLGAAEVPESLERIGAP